MELTHKEFSQRFAALSTDLGSHEVEALIGLLHRREVPAGDPIIVEGQPSGALFLIWDGTTVVTVGGAEVGRYGAGATVGEISFLDGKTATASVVAAAPVALLWMDRSTFESLHVDHPRIATCLLHAVCREVSSRVRKSTDLLESLRQSRVSTVAERPAPRVGLLNAIRQLLGLDTAGDEAAKPNDGSRS